MVNDPRPLLAASLLLIAGGVLFAMRRAQASAPAGYDLGGAISYSPEEGGEATDPQDLGAVLLSLAQDFNPFNFPAFSPDLEQLQAMSTENNLKALLQAIRTAEGTASANGYRYLFGSTYRREKLFDSFADHPRIRTYETSDNFIRNGKLDYTTAAGAYQITGTTFDRMKKKLGLSDFSPAAQDAIAIELIRERGALDDARAGRFDAAIAKLGTIWASLPSATYGQPTKTLAAMRGAYSEAGGSFA